MTFKPQILYNKASIQNKLNNTFNSEDAISIEYGVEIKRSIERSKRIN